MKNESKNKAENIDSNDEKLLLSDVRQRCKQILSKHSGINIQYLTDEKLDIDFESCFYDDRGFDYMLDDLNKYIAKLCKHFKINKDLSFTEYKSFARFDDICEDVFNNVV